MTEAYQPVPGPADRESFFDAQARHRRASWWFTAVSALMIAVMGIPLSAVISPLLYAAAVIVLDVVRLVVHATPDLLAGLAKSKATTSNAPLTPAQIAAVAAFLVVPGSLTLLLSWLGVRALFRDAGAEGVVLALGAREPGRDLEEQQVVNVVGEMAAAAGVPVPRVRIIESPVPNAGAVGTRMDDAIVVVTTGLLQTLDRDQTQGVIGHVVGSVGNGDLRIGATILSLYQTLGLVGSVLRAPSEGKPRTTLRTLLRYAFRRNAGDAAALATLLTSEGANADTGTSTSAKWGPVRSMLLVPFVMAGGAFTMTTMVFGWLVVGPVLHRAWRARRFLADATAVELTRNPDGLARALDVLGEQGNVVPGAEWAAHLFVVGRPKHVAVTESDGSLAAFQPSTPQRVQRLNALGANVEARGLKTAHERKVLRVALLVTSPCWLAGAAFLIGATLLLTAISLALDSLFLAPVVAIVHALLLRLGG